MGFTMNPELRTINQSRLRWFDFAHHPELVEGRNSCARRGVSGAL